MIRSSQLAASLAAVATCLAGCATTANAPGGGNTASFVEPHKPFQILGNTYYVGTAGVSSILIVSDYGSVLIDGGPAAAAGQIAANIEALGFKLDDVKAILVSHAHYDHVGGIAELQRLTGAKVYAMRPAQQALLAGAPTSEDPQYGSKTGSFPKLDRVWVVQDDQLLGVGNVRLRALATPGHTAGGASWSWDACDGSKCLQAVLADSLNAVSESRYRFKDHPEVLEQFEASFARLEAAPCQLLLTVHPASSGGLDRLEAASNDADKLEDAAACKTYVQQGRAGLATRLASEGG